MVAISMQNYSSSVSQVRDAARAARLPCSGHDLVVCDGVALLYSFHFIWFHFENVFILQAQFSFRRLICIYMPLTWFRLNNIFLSLCRYRAADGVCWKRGAHGGAIRFLAYILMVMYKHFDFGKASKSSEMYRAHTDPSYCVLRTFSRNLTMYSTRIFYR